MRKNLKFKPKGSNTTTPISREQFEYILNDFHDRKDTRMEIVCHLMFKAIRVGDVLKTIKIQDVYESNGTVKDKIQFHEEKTGKLRTVPIKGEKFITALNAYYTTLKPISTNQPMFYTRKTGEVIRDSGVKKLLRYFIGKRGITQCRPHSFRKGGARFMFENNVRIENISHVLNHHSTKVTETYICITPVDIEKSMACLEI